MDITRAILYKYPNAKFSAVGLDYEGLTWLDQSPKPSEADLQEAYVEMQAAGIDPLKGEDWLGLESDLRGSPVWAKAFSAAERTIKANAAWTLLVVTVTRTHSLIDLEFAIFKMREAMQGISGIGDFTPEEITSINQLFEVNGFRFKL